MSQATLERSVPVRSARDFATLEKVTNEKSVAKRHAPTGLAQRIFAYLSSLVCLPRFQLVECCDQAWLKGVWREAYMDGLDFLLKLGGVYKQMHRPFSRWARGAGHDRVLDLGSGNGGPVETLARESVHNKVTMPITYLSDLYPDLDAYRDLARDYPENVNYLNQPVDALHGLDKIEDCPKLVSICSAFHHFPPAQAKKLLEQMVRHSDGLFIMEVFERNAITPLQPLFNVLPLMLAPFFARRFRFSKLLIGTVLPLIPLMIIFDGVVSALRSYRLNEIWEMLPEQAKKEWHWEAGRQRYLGIFSAPYFFGYRRTSSSTQPEAMKAKGATRSRPWEVARWGRLLAGLGVAVFTLLGILHHPGWMVGTLLTAFNLIFTSVTDHCVLNKLLVRWGAREREDLFHPGGDVRHH